MLCTMAWSHEPIKLFIHTSLYPIPTTKVVGVCYHGTSQLHHLEIGLSMRFGSAALGSVNARETILSHSFYSAA